jgi:RHS repeat-associated protein
VIGVLLSIVRRTDVRSWKVYGPDLNGRFGGLQGTGGLEAVILDANGTTTGVINDQFGNGVATVSGGTVTWNTTRVGAYGPLPGIVPQTLGDVTQLAAATAWRGHRIDPTGFYWLGARYYEPTNGRFLSADPMGHAASPSLYDYAGGDPANSFDSDGRLASKLAAWKADPKNDAKFRALYGAVAALNAFNAQNSGANDDGWYWRGVGEAARGYFWNGPKNAVVGLLEMGTGYAWYRQVSDEFRAASDAMDNPNGFVAGMEAWREKSQDALVKELTRLATTNEGNGEFAFAITTLILGGEGIASRASVAESGVLEGSSVPSKTLGVLLRSTPFTAEEAAAMKAAEEAVGLEGARQRLDVIAEALLRRGYTPEEVVKLMGSIQGGGGLKP